MFKWLYNVIFKERIKAMNYIKDVDNELYLVLKVTKVVRIKNRTLYGDLQFDLLNDKDIMYLDVAQRLGGDLYIEDVRIPYGFCLKALDIGNILLIDRNHPNKSTYFESFKDFNKHVYN